MLIKREYEIDFRDIYDLVYSYDRCVLDEISIHGKEDEFMDLLDNYFSSCDDVPSDIEIGDFINGEKEFIFKELGIGDDE